MDLEPQYMRLFVLHQLQKPLLNGERASIYMDPSRPRRLPDLPPIHDD